MANISSFSTSASGNTSAPPHGFPEAQSPSSLNDAARELMASIARWYQDSNGTLITTGSGNSFVLTTNSAHATLSAQSFFAFQVDRANTGAATLNVDGLGAKSMRIAGVALASGQLVADTVVIAVYNDTDDAYDLLSGFRIATGGITADMLATGAATTVKIPDEAVTNAKLAHMTQSTIKGRAAGAGTGDATDLTATQVRTLINVENGATADQSAAEILAAVKSVDGAGSGLDADALDGIDGSNYLRSDISDTFTGTLAIVGAISCSGNITSNTSDERLKADWGELESTLDRMESVSLRGTYYFTDEARGLNPNASQDRQLGFSAQQIQRHWPEAVAPAPFDIDPETGESISGRDFLTIRYESLVPVLWQAVLDLRAELKALKEES